MVGAPGKPRVAAKERQHARAKRSRRIGRTGKPLSGRSYAAVALAQRLPAASTGPGVRSPRMATIRIDRPHHMAKAQAKALAERLAHDFEQRFELDWRWDGDDVHFRRPGMSGQMHVGETNIVLEVRLGMLLSPLKPAIERQMNAQLDALDRGPTNA
jgi:putative polyhydroxyalkanoate system protein